MRRFHFLPVVLLIFVVSTLTGSALSDLAASLQAGEWGVLSTNNFQNGSILRTDDNGTLTEYSDEAQWDPVGQKLYIMGTARGACACYGTNNQKWVTYDEATNAWTAMPRPSFYWGFHGYDHAALDPVRRHYYIRSVASREVHRYDITAAQWSSIPDMPTSYQACCSALEYFPEIDRVVFSYPVENEFHLYNPATNTWSSVIPWGYSVGNTIHNITEYDAVNKVIYFSGENGTTDLFQLDTAGNVTKLANAPVSLGISGTCTQHTVDPVTGKFLLFKPDSNIYEYDPAGNSWRTTGKHPLFNPIYSGRMIAVSAKIPEYGVIISVKWDGGNSKVYLYRHMAGTAVQSSRSAGPEALSLSVTPNPATGRALIRASAAGDKPLSSLRLRIYDPCGRLVATYAGKDPQALAGGWIWNTRAFPSGIYLVRLQTHEKILDRRVTVMH
jgi:hypothetical protein